MRILKPCYNCCLTPLNLVTILVVSSFHLLFFFFYDVHHMLTLFSYNSSIELFALMANRLSCYSHYLIQCLHFVFIALCFYTFLIRHLLLSSSTSTPLSVGERCCGAPQHLIAQLRQFSSVAPNSKCPSEVASMTTACIFTLQLLCLSVIMLLSRTPRTIRTPLAPCLCFHSSFFILHSPSSSFSHSFLPLLSIM